MTIAEWQQLPPDAAAREVRARARTLLSDPQRAAVIAWMPDEASLERAFAEASRGIDYPLGGVPFLAKDLFDVAGAPTCAGSTFLPEVRPAPRLESALIRAARGAGLVCAGKTHLHEFAYGITGENPHYGDCEHPGFPGRTTGGSSSGSAAAVAAGIVPVALGTDTGGSIRVPAAFCGLFGLRLSPGDAWIRDAFPLAPSFDTAGWLTANAVDMQAVVSALVGLTTADRAPRGCYLDLPNLDPDIAQACRTAAASFAAPADDASRASLLQGFAETLPAYNTLVTKEAWAVHAPWAERFRDHYDPVVWQRLKRHATLTPAEVEAAMRVRAAVQVVWTKFFLAYDFLILPATPCAALTKADCTAANRTRLLSVGAPASVGGLPVLTVPVPLPSGLSTGLQFVVNHPRSPVLSWVLARCAEQSRRVVV